MLKTHVPMLLLAACSIQMSAEDGDAWNLRLSVGTAPGISKDSTTNSTTASGAADPANNTDQTLSATYGIDVQAGARWSRVFPNGFGIVAGPDLFFRSVGGKFTMSGASIKETLDAFGVRLVAGPTMTIDNKIRFELTPFLEGGGATDKVDGTAPGISLSQTSKLGSYFGYGITAGAFYAFNKHFEAGVQVGYQGFTSQVKFAPGSLTNDNQTDTLTGSGFIGNVTAVW